jgi:hypothetical protein
MADAEECGAGRRRASRTLTWRNALRSPSASATKPKPFSASNHVTVPSAISPEDCTPAVDGVRKKFWRRGNSRSRNGRGRDPPPSRPGRGVRGGFMVRS